MEDNLGTILLELDTLARVTHEDFEKQFWNNYIKYLEQYNDILKRLQALGYFKNEKFIEPVPEGQRAYMHVGFSSAETAKLREVVNSSNILLGKLKMQTPLETRPIQTSGFLERIEHLCSRFHIVACQLQRRRENRNTLKIDDEYDVQDLFHALLSVDFDDIRTEEWTPSYAGGSSRMDFVLRKENVVIETKMTRKGLDAKQLGEDLLIDIAKYKNYQYCKTLVCFAYDPEGRIQNPRGLEQDLQRATTDVKVIVFIRPTGE